MAKKRERREKEKYRKFSSSSCKNIWSTLSERWRDREILEREEEARPNKKNGKKDRLNSLYIDRMREKNVKEKEGGRAREGRLKVSGDGGGGGRERVKYRE